MNAVAPTSTVQSRSAATVEIAAARIGPGHDGRAEVVLDLLYPNGALAQMSVPQEAAERAMDAAGITNLAELVGQPWTLLVHGSEFLVS